MSIECLTSAAQLDEFWPDWDALWRRQQATTPFQSPAWLRPWWLSFGTDEPRIVLLHGGNALRAALPLYRFERKLLPIGIGTTDYIDALCDGDRSAQDSLLGTALRDSDVIRCDIPDLPEGALLRSARSPRGWIRETWPGPPCPVLSLQPEPAIPSSMRRDIRQARHRAKRAGGFSVRRATSATCEATLDTLIRFHTARWRARGTPGVLSDARTQQFLRRAAVALQRSGLLRLETLLIADVPAAAIFALVHRQALYFYLGGFDPEKSFHSPSLLLMAHMIEEAACESRIEAHFLRGGERYKYAWGARDRHNLGLSFSRT